MSESTLLTVATALALEAPVTATPVSLAVPNGTPYAAWERLGAELRTLGNWSPWALGDWYLAGERLYGEEAAQAVSDLGLDIHTLQNAAWVCSRFLPERRRPLLSHAHHGEVASFLPDLADGWLKLAEEEGWSRSELRAAIREARREQAAEETNGVVELPPVISHRGVVEVNGGLAYVGLTALGDLLSPLEGYEVELTARPLGPTAEEAECATNPTT